MKRAVSFFLILTFVSSVSGAVDYFRSNALGMKLELIAPFRTDEFEYTLEVEKDEHEETRVLLHRGREVRTWVLKTLEEGKSVEIEITGDEKITRERLNGRIVRETVERGGETEEIRKFIYEADGLAGKEVSGPEGLLYADRFERTAEGRLRRVIREFSDGRVSTSRYSSGSEGLTEELHASGRSSTRFRYSGNVLVMEEEWSEGELVSRIEYFDEDSRSIETNFRTGEVITREYDEEERIVREIVEKDGARETRRYSYDGDNLAVEERRTAGIPERWEYVYNPDGSTAAFDYYRNGILIKSRVFSRDDTYHDIIMRDGHPILTVYYEEHVRVRTEYMSEEGASLEGSLP